MSTRGYMTVVTYPTTNALFKVDSADPIFKFLEDHDETNDRRNHEGGGFLEVHIDALKELREHDLTDSQKVELELNIKEAGNSEWILYDCY